MRLFWLNMEISRVSKSETGTYHLIENNDLPDHFADQTVCGARFKGYRVTHDVTRNHIAFDAAENLCESCRRQADKAALMPIYERADEHANANA